MSKLLGDKVEEIFEKTGVKKVVEKAAAAVGIEDCGCSGRKTWLNDLGKRMGLGPDGAAVELPPPIEDQDPNSPANRRARNKALKDAWEKEHGRPYGSADPG